MRNMRSIILTCALCTLSIVGYSQSVGIGTVAPSINAALEVAQGGTPQGILIPKMNSANMVILDGLCGSGDEGLLIYNTDSAAFMYWDGVDFVNMASAMGGADTDWIESGNYITNASDSVGVGVSTPLADLEVDGRIMSDSLTINGPGFVGDDLNVGNNLRVGNDIFVLNGGWITVSGNIVADSIILAGLEANGSYGTVGQVLTSGGPGGALTWATAASDADWTESGNYVINMTDSVGIGVAVPLADLDVKGRIKSDSLTVNGVSYFGGGMSIGGTYDPAFSLRVYGKFKSAGLTETSDERLKEDISTVKNALEAVMQLRGVTYHWIDREQDPELQIGLIAQELEEVYPELVDTDTEGFKSVQYSKLVAVLIEGMKEQQLQINALQEKVKEIDTLKAEVDSIKAHLLGTSVVK